MQDLRNTELGRVYGEWEVEGIGGRGTARKLGKGKSGPGSDAIYTKQNSTKIVYLSIYIVDIIRMEPQDVGMFAGYKTQG